jgi:hypothetical protein
MHTVTCHLKRQNIKVKNNRRPLSGNGSISVVPATTNMLRDKTNMSPKNENMFLRQCRQLLHQKLGPSDGVTSRPSN